MNKYLSGDVLREILCRLPIKSLLRFKSVCRAWCILVEDHSFADLHLTRSKQNTYATNFALLNYKESKSRRKSLHLLHVSQAIGDGVLKPSVSTVDLKHLARNTQISFCNGFLCYPRSSSDSSSILYVCNPITGESLSLLKSYTVPHYRYGTFFSYGIGFDSATGDYKVVRMVCSHSSELWEAEICTLGETLSWRYIGKKRIRYLYHGAGFSVDGALHWRTHPASIFSVDIESEKFRTIDCPFDPSPGCPFQLMEWNGCLSVVEKIDRDQCTNIWVFKDNPQREGKKMKSWTKELHIEWRHSIRRLDPLCVQIDSESLVKIWFEEFCSCSVKNGRLWSFEFGSPVPSYNRWIMDYIPSLVTLRKIPKRSLLCGCFTGPFF